MADSRRVKLGFKLAASAAGFLCLTVLVAFGLRTLTGVNQTRGPASIEAGSVFEHRGNLSASELGMLGSAPLKRGRRVVFHQNVFMNRALTAPNQVALNLFPDTTLIAHIQEPSAYTVNEGLFTGTILGDDESSVRILIQNGAVDGSVKFRGTEYRIVDGGLGGQSIVTEAKLKAPKATSTSR
jgi:hypothetical protein